MKDVHAPTFGYKVRPDLEKEVVRAMLANYRVKHPDAMELRAGGGRGRSYFFDEAIAEDLERHLRDDGEVAMGAVSIKRNAGIAANKARACYREQNLLLVDMVIDGQRIMLTTRDQVTAFLGAMAAYNDSLMESVAKLEAKVAEANQRATTAARNMNALQAQMLAAGVKPRVRATAGKLRFIAPEERIAA